MSIPEYVYSLDGEWFEEFDVIQDQVNDDAEPGEKVSGYRGTPIQVDHADHVKHLKIVELLQELAYDEDGEAAENYLMDFDDEKEDQLKDVIIKWMDNNIKKPGYFRVGEIQDHIFTSELYDE